MKKIVLLLVLCFSTRAASVIGSGAFANEFDGGADGYSFNLTDGPITLDVGVEGSFYPGSYSLFGDSFGLASGVGRIGNVESNWFEFSIFNGGVSSLTLFYSYQDPEATANFSIWVNSAITVENVSNGEIEYEAGTITFLDTPEPRFGWVIGLVLLTIVIQQQRQAVRHTLSVR